MSDHKDQAKDTIIPLNVRLTPSESSAHPRATNYTGKQKKAKGVRVRRREAGGTSRMQESHKVRPSQSPWPRVMRSVGQPAGRSVHRGTAGRCIELRKHPCAVADLVLTRGRQ